MKGNLRVLGEAVKYSTNCKMKNQIKIKKFKEFFDNKNLGGKLIIVSFQEKKSAQKSILVSSLRAILRRFDWQNKFHQTASVHTCIIYKAWTLLSWNHVMSKTCPTRVSDMRVVCIFKNLPHVRVSSSFQCCLIRAT